MAVLQINILGTSFQINAEEDPKHLEKIREYYKNVCDEIQRSDNISDQKQIAVLAGILISDQLLKERKKNEKLKDNAKTVSINSDLDEKTNQITQNMIDKIDKALQ